MTLFGFGASVKSFKLKQIELLTRSYFALIMSNIYNQLEMAYFDTEGNLKNISTDELEKILLRNYEEIAFTLRKNKTNANKIAVVSKITGSV